MGDKEAGCLEDLSEAEVQDYMVDTLGLERTFLVRRGWIARSTTSLFLVPGDPPPHSHINSVYSFGRSIFFEGLHSILLFLHFFTLPPSPCYRRSFCLFLPFHYSFLLFERVLVSLDAILSTFSPPFFFFIYSYFIPPIHSPLPSSFPSFFFFTF